MSDTQQRINKNINDLKIIRDKVSHLFMPVRYFKTLNILPKSLVDEEIINKNFDEKWLHKKYCEIYSFQDIRDIYSYSVYEDYMRHYKLKLNEILKQNKINSIFRLQIMIDKTDFDNNFDMYIKEINFDLSPYYMKYFEGTVSSKITEYTNNIDKLTNCLTIEDLERLTKKGCKVVFKKYSGVFTDVLVKVCPKTVSGNTEI